MLKCWVDKDIQGKSLPLRSPCGGGEWKRQTHSSKPGCGRPKDRHYAQSIEGGRRMASVVSLRLNEQRRLRRGGNKWGES